MARTLLARLRPSRLFHAQAGIESPTLPLFARMTVLAAIPCWYRAFQFRYVMGVWLMLPFALPCLMAACSRSQRDLLLQMLRRRVVELARYARDPARHALPWTAGFLFVGLPSLALYLSNLVSEAQTDSFSVMPAAVSLVREGNTDLDEFLDAPTWARLTRNEGRLPHFLINRQGGREVGFEPVHSAYPAGMVQFAMPVAIVGRLSGARTGDLAVINQMEKLTAALVSASTATLFFLTALHLGSLGGAAVATACFAAASGLFSLTAQLLWQQGGILFWMLVALLAEFRHQVRPHRATKWVQGLACSGLAACRPSAAIFLVPFGSWLALRDFKRACQVVSIALVAYLPWAIYYLSIYGRLFGPTSDMLDPVNWTSHLMGPLAGLLVSPARGLLVYQPWLIVLPLALLARPNPAREPSSWRKLAAVVMTLQVLMVAAWGMWWGGHSWASRLVLEVVALGGLLCVAPMSRLLDWRGGRALLGALFVAGFLAQVPMIYGNAHHWNAEAEIDTHADRLWSWTRAPFLWPITHDAPRS